MPQVTESIFRELLQERLGAQYNRALELFRECGPNLAFDIVNVLTHAGDQGPTKVEEVLGLLEKHEREHLHFQHPDIKGQIANMGVNPTERLFLHICKQVLGLQPNPSAPAHS